VLLHAVQSSGVFICFLLADERLSALTAENHNSPQRYRSAKKTKLAQDQYVAVDGGFYAGYKRQYPPDEYNA